MDFFGTIINVFYGPSKSLVQSCAILCLLVKVLFVTMTNKYYRLPKLSEELQPKIDEIDKKFRHDINKRNKAVSDLLVKSEYPFLANATYYVLMMVFTVLLCICAHDPAAHVEAFDPEASLKFLMIPDVTQYTYVYIKDTWPDIRVLLYILLPVLACGIQFGVSTYMSGKSLVNVRWFDFVSVAATLVACTLLPPIFSICWIVFEVASIIQILFNLKSKTPVKASKKS